MTKQGLLKILNKYKITNTMFLNWNLNDLVLILFDLMNFFFFTNYFINIFFFLFIIIFFNFIYIFFLQKMEDIHKIYKFYVYYIKLCLSIILILFLYHVLILLFFNNNTSPLYVYYSLTIFGIYLDFCLDNLSLIFLLLVTFIIFLCLILHAYLPILNKINSRYKRLNNNTLLFDLNLSYLKNTYLYTNLLIILLYILFFFFTTLNILFLYITLELSMLPVFFIIVLFGSRYNKLKAGYYIFLYTVISSVPFLSGVLCLYILTGSLNLIVLSSYIFDVESQKIFWILFFLPFATKVPMIPLHIWLPEAHVEAPTEGSVILAGLLLKLGFYGIIRFLIPLFPSGWLYFSVIFYSLSIVSIVYASILIFCQIDLKKIIAYSSIAHMNFALLGLFSISHEGFLGSIYICFTHGIISSGLFICIGYLYSRFYTRLLIYYSGITYYFPLFSSFLFLFILGNISLPGTGSFVGELLVILSLINDNIYVCLVSILGSLFCTIYSILLYTKICFGTTFFFMKNKHIVFNYNDKIDIFESNMYNIISNTKYDQRFNQNFIFIEYMILFFLVLLIFVTGLFPMVYLNMFQYTFLYNNV